MARAWVWRANPTSSSLLVHKRLWAYQLQVKVLAYIACPRQFVSLSAYNTWGLQSPPSNPQFKSKPQRRTTLLSVDCCRFRHPPAADRTRSSTRRPWRGTTPSRRFSRLRPKLPTFDERPVFTIKRRRYHPHHDANMNSPLVVLRQVIAVLVGRPRLLDLLALVHGVGVRELRQCKDQMERTYFERVEGGGR